MLFQCWASVADDGPTLKQHRVNVPYLRNYINTQQTQHVQTNVVQRWTNVKPTLIERLMSAGYEWCMTHLCCPPCDELRRLQSCARGRAVWSYRVQSMTSRSSTCRVLHLANTRRRPNGVKMLSRCRRRRANIKTTLGQRLVSAGVTPGDHLAYYTDVAVKHGTQAHIDSILRQHHRRSGSIE